MQEMTNFTHPIELSDKELDLVAAGTACQPCGHELIVSAEAEAEASVIVGKPCGLLSVSAEAEASASVRFT